jgi:hypothetical protein
VEHSYQFRCSEMQVDPKGLHDSCGPIFCIVTGSGAGGGRLPVASGAIQIEVGHG